MYKIFVKGNYFYIERVSDGRIFEGHKKNVLVSSLTETSDDFYFWNINGTINCDNKLNIADLVDEASVPFTVATFRAFIEENTGNFNSGVPAALNGPYNRLVNYFADNYTDLTTNIALTPVDGEIAIVRNAQGTAWLPYNLGGTYYPKGGYIYNGANWIPQTDLITQQLQINVDDINGLETDVANHITDLSNPHAVTKVQVGLGNVQNIDTTTTANITDSLNKRFVTDANITTIGNQSGTNTGDETTGSIQSKRPLKTIEGQSLEGAGNIDLQKSDVGLGNVENTSDANKPVSIATQNALDLKVDKVTGKELSDENYTLAEKNKLAGIAAGAEVNVQSDWNEANPASDAFIQNKPIIPTVPANIVQTASGQVVDNTDPANPVFNENTYIEESTIIAGSTTGAWVVRSLGIAYANSDVELKVYKTADNNISTFGVREVGSIVPKFFPIRRGTVHMEVRADAAGDIEIQSNNTNITFEVTGRKSVL